MTIPSSPSESPVATQKNEHLLSRDPTNNSEITNNKRPRIFYKTIWGRATLGTFTQYSDASKEIMERFRLEDKEINALTLTEPI